MDRYYDYKPLLQAAVPSREIWRLACGLALIVVAYFALVFLLLTVARALPGWPAMTAEIVSGSTPRAMWFMLASFGALCAALYIALRIFHDRGFRSLLGPLRLVVRDFWRVLRLVIVLFAVLLLIPSPEGLSLERNLSLGRWLPLLIVSLPLIMLQIGAEELVFRGYLQSQLAARFRHPLIWLLVPSLLFGALHYDPATYGGNAALLALWAALFGLVAADLTARTGNLGAALAVHFANNVKNFFLFAPSMSMENTS